MGAQWQSTIWAGIPRIVLTWEDAMRSAPGENIERCEEALTDRTPLSVCPQGHFS